MRDNVSKYFILVIAILAVIILIIILIVYFVSNNRINSNDLARVNGQVLTKTDLISYNCSLTQKSSSNCATNYIGQLQNLINYTLEKQYLEKYNDLPTKKQVYTAMFYPSAVPPNVSHIKNYNNIYYSTYVSLVVKNIQKLLVKNATGNIFVITNNNVTNFNTVLSLPIEKNILNGFRNKLLSGKYTVQELNSSENQIQSPYNHFFYISKYNRFNQSNATYYYGNLSASMIKNIFSLGVNKVSPIYTYVYIVKNKVISTYYYFFENTNIEGRYSNISGVLNYLRGSASITLY